MDRPSEYLHKARNLINKFRFLLPEGLSDRLLRTLSDPTYIQTIGLWAAALVASMVAVLYAKMFTFAEHLFHTYVASHPVALFLGTPACFILAWYLVRKFGPDAGGSGIPQIMAANEAEHIADNKTFVDRLLSLRTAAVKVVSSLLCVVGGGAIGREGPTLQVSACIFHFFGGITRRFNPKHNHSIWVTAGAASGLASAFNTPLGGIVYAIEELGLVHFQKIRTALLSGVIVSGLVSQWLLGSYLYLGYPELVRVGFSMVPAALVNGIVAGLLGALFGKVLVYLVNQRALLVKNSQLLVVAGLCGLIAAALYSLDSRAAGPGVHVINGFLFADEKPSLWLIFIRFVSTMVSYLTGAAGGIFAPSLAVGASIGAYLTEIFSIAHPHLMVLLGMIGFLTGVTRTPFTSFILVLEMTDRHSAILPMMAAAVAANWSARLLDQHSFYEHIKEKYLARLTLQRKI